VSGQDPADRRRADGPTVHGDAVPERCVDDVIAEQDRSATTRRQRRVVHFRRRRQTCARCAMRVLGRAIGGQRHSVYIRKSIHTHTRLTALFLGLPRWAGTRKAKPIWILLKQETVSGSGISWAICKSAPRCRQITMPAHHHSVFHRPDALPAAQPTASKH